MSGKSKLGRLCSLCLCFLLLSGAALAAEHDMPYYGKAYVHNPRPEDRLNLREGPGSDYASLGLYYNGVEALCWSDPAAGEWMLVTVGQVAGYMKRQYLSLEDEGLDIASAAPLMVVKNPESGAGLNLREEPDLSAGALSLYPNGQPVVVMGIRSEWAHVRVGAETGYMLRNYLAPAEDGEALLGPAETLAAAEGAAVPSGVAVSARVGPRSAAPSGAEGFRYLERGYTVVCAVGKLAGGGYDAHAVLAYDKGYEGAEDVAAFRLYLGGEAVATLEPYGEAHPPTVFRCTFAYEGEMDPAELVPVLATGQEEWAETVPLMPR